MLLIAKPRQVKAFLSKKRAFKMPIKQVLEERLNNFSKASVWLSRK